MTTERKNGLVWTEFPPNNGVVRFEADVPTPEKLSLENLTIHYAYHLEKQYEAMYVDSIGEFSTFEEAEDACIRAAVDDCKETIALYETTVQNLNALKPRNTCLTESEQK